MAVYSRREIEAGGLNKAPSAIEAPAQAEEIPEPAPEKPRKPRASDPWFYLQHPDATAGNQINATFEVAGEMVTIERSRVETQNPAVKDALVRSGWIWMNEEFKQ